MTANPDALRRAADEVAELLRRDAEHRAEIDRLTSQRSGHHTPAFVAMDWRTVAEWMGATLVRADPERGEVTVFRGGAFVDGAWRPDEVLIISDNGGEVNVSAVVPRLDFSLPYEQTHRVVGPATLGVWLQQALNGAADKIDYFDDLDAPVTP